MKSLIVASALASLAACTMMEKAPDPAAGIAASNAAFEAAFNAGDAAGVGALYAADAVVLPPNMARNEGRAAIQAFWKGFIDAGLADLDLMTDSLVASGDSATELGRFTVKAPDGKGGMATVAGKYVVLWQRGDDGVWRLQWDIWNDEPAM